MLQPGLEPVNFFYSSQLPHFRVSLPDGTCRPASLTPILHTTRTKFQVFLVLVPNLYSTISCTGRCLTLLQRTYCTLPDSRDQKIIARLFLFPARHVLIDPDRNFFGIESKLTCGASRLSKRLPTPHNLYRSQNTE